MGEAGTSTVAVRSSGDLATTAWLAERRRVNDFEVSRIPFEELVDWRFEPGTGNLTHRSGRFFTIEGLHVRSDYGAVAEWSQPIIVQPEVGILGVLVRRVEGVVECLLQAKMEPGNVNVIQLSPTVQATKSNYTKVHKGHGTNYLEHFVGRSRGRVLFDVLLSEQASWFYRKRNRNMIVEVDPDVDVLPDFRWLPLTRVRHLLAMDNTINMDARSVLSCLPLAAPDALGQTEAGADGFSAAVARSFEGSGCALHTGHQVLNWFTEVKTRRDVVTRRIPLARVARWHCTAHEIAHDDGRYFSVVAVAVRASNREVERWTQPLVHPRGQGIVAFLTGVFDGVLHVLVHARVEPGYVDVVELGPTVQCTPANYAGLPSHLRPAFLDDVLRARPDQIRFDTVLSEEGGRFHHAQNRYVVVDAGSGVVPGPGEVPPDFHWVTLGQLSGLLRHCGYVNVQARSLLACLDTLR